MAAASPKTEQCILGFRKQGMRVGSWRGADGEAWRSTNDHKQHGRKRKGLSNYEGCAARQSWSRAVKESRGGSDATFIIQSELLEASGDKNTFLNLLNDLSARERPLNIVNIATILHKTGKMRLPLHIDVAKYLTLRLRRLDHHEQIKSIAVGNALYGLRSTGDSPEVRQLVAALTHLVQQCRELDAQAVGNALYGLQSMGGSAEVRQLVSALTPKVQQCREELRSQEVGNALYGLHSMHDSAEVRQLVVALIPKVQQCRELDAQAVGNALYGLQSMGDSAEVRQLVTALTPKVQQCREELKAQAVGNALYGLQCLGDSEKVRQLVAALVPKVQQCREDLTAQQVGNALFALQSLGDSTETRKLLAALTPKVEQCCEELKAQHVGIPLYWLQRLGKSEELRQFWAALTRKAQDVAARDAQEVSHALSELQRGKGMRPLVLGKRFSEVRRILRLAR